MQERGPCVSLEILSGSAWHFNYLNFEIVTLPKEASCICIRYLFLHSHLSLKRLS